MSSSAVLSVSSPTPTVAAPDHPSLSHPLDSQYDHRSVLEVVGWSLAIMTTLIVAVRMGTKWSISHRLEVDDLLVAVSLILAFGQTGSLSTAVSNGLGLVSPGSQDAINLEGQQKSMYAFNILFIVSQCFAKVSITVFTGRLTPVELHRRACKTLIVGISLWAVIAAIALLFQCQLPRPWQTIDGTCINRVALYTYVEVVNAILDVVLIAIPVMIVWSLNQTRARKFAIIGTFLTRSMVIAVIIVQLIILHTAPNTVPDPFLRWNFAICTQVIEYLSIISACALYLKPFLRNAASGMLSHATAPASNIQHNYYRHFNGKKFVKARLMVSSFRESRAEPIEGVELQHTELPINITVKKYFEMQEHRIDPESAGNSSDGSHAIME